MPYSLEKRRERAFEVRMGENPMDPEDSRIDLSMSIVHWMYFIFALFPLCSESS